MKKLLSAIGFLLAISCVNNQPVTAQTNEQKTHINIIFDRMEAEGVVTSDSLLYGYFFYEKEKTRLINLNKSLQSMGFRTARFEKTGTEDYILHVEKVEVHSRSSLTERQGEFDRLARKHAVSNYDGWDVGNADPSKPIVNDNSFSKSLTDKSDEEIFNLATVLYEGGMYSKALAALQRCIDHQYKVDTASYRKAVCFIELGDKKTGIEVLKNLVRTVPTHFKAWFALGATYYEEADYQRSITSYQKAGELNKDDDRVYYGIAASQFVLGNLKDAELNCNLALKLNPMNENAQLLIKSIDDRKK